MSQSPITDFSEQIVQKYKHRWSALDRLLHSDRSFSGNERHCAFLNLEGDGFADISAVTGFDFAEDGRALVTDDWDFDGDLDVWVTARTAPRVRFLENQSQNEGQALFVRLFGNGTTTNPEAIGARCEVWLKGDQRPITRTLKAGDSFLSQTGSWLHFGLGNEAEIAKVLVHWPAGEKEEFTGLASGRRYFLHQGQSQAKQWTPPKETIVASTEPLVLPRETESARIVLPTPLLLPQLESHDGKPIAPNSDQGPILINLWSQTCSGCLEELTEWTRHSTQIQAAGLKIKTLNVDSPSPNETNSEAIEFLKRIKFPFLTSTTNEATLDRLDLFQRSILDRWLPLPVPCSFLVDGNGKTVVIYKGPVASETLIADLKLIGANPETLRDAATSFSGSWAEPAPFIGPKNYVIQLLDHRKLDEIERYYQSFLALEKERPNPPTNPMVEALKTLSTIATQRRQFDKAVSHLADAVALVPQAPDLQALLQKAQSRANKAKENSLPTLIAKVEAEPTNGKAHLALANAYRNNQEPAKAVASYKNALRNDPKLFVAAGRLGWILATHPSPEIREPRAALEIANRLIAIHGEADPNFLDLRGIAQAANGDFAAATTSAQAALALLKEESPYQKAVQYRLELYQAGKPYYEGQATK